MIETTSTELIKSLERRRKNLPDFILDYSYKLEMNVSVSSCVSYLSDINTFLEFMVQCNKTAATSKNSITIEEIAMLDLHDVYHYLSFLTSYEVTHITKKGHKKRMRYKNNQNSKTHKCIAMRELFEYFLKKQMIRYNFWKDIKYDKKKVAANVQSRLTKKEVKALIETIDNSSTATETESFIQSRDLLLVLILLKTGIRVHELCNLNVADINIIEETFIVTRKGNIQQNIPFPKKIIPLLHLYLRIRQKKGLDNVFLFSSLQNKRLRTRSVQNIVNKYAKIAGIDKKVSPHTLRRTFGTSFYNNTKDMYLTAYILGHASAETTRKFYAIPDIERAHQSVQAFNYD